jgi:RNA polymerase sigma factor (sigma-70 family)
MNGSDLLAKYRNTGSEPAFTDLLRQYSGLVYAAARRRLPSHAVAEEVTQVVFTQLAKKPPLVKNDGELAGWLHRTTVHIAIDAWRTEIRRQTREQEAVLLESAPGAEDTRIWEELTPHLDEALDQLGEGDRQAVLLRYFEGKSMRDVGAGLGISEDAAKMRVSPAVSRLRDELVRRGVTCSVVLLAAVLSRHAAEAAPAQLIVQLIALHLAMPAGTTGAGASMAQLLKSKVALVSTAVSILVLTLLIALRPGHSDEPRVSETKLAPTQSPPDRVISSRRIPKPASVNAPSVQSPDTRFILHVMNTEDGRSLPDAKIRVGYFYMGGEGEGEEHEAVTDSDGNAPIPYAHRPGTAPGANIFVCVTGYVPKCFSVKGSDHRTEYVLKLEPAALLAGIVTDEEGLPVPGVELTAHRDDRIDHYHNDAPTTDFQTCKVVTDEAGRWTFSFAPQSYLEMRFDLTCSNYAATSAIVPVAAPDSQHMRLVISRGFVVVGRVTDADGNPVENAEIVEYHNFLYRKLSTKSGPDGAYELRGLSSPAVYEIALDWRGFNPNKPPTREEFLRKSKAKLGKPKQQKVELVVQAKGLSPQIRIVELLEPTNQVDFVLGRATVFRGHIVDENGNPVSGAIVRTDMDFENQVDDRFQWFTHATPDGKFEWDSAPSQTLCFWFEADGHEIIRGTPILPDGTDHEIVLRRKRSSAN